MDETFTTFARNCKDGGDVVLVMMIRMTSGKGVVGVV